MKFKRFTSLVNGDDGIVSGSLGRAILEVEGDWVVTEKVDGCNFAFYVDSSGVKVASRNQFVDGTFYNCQEVINRYEDSVKGLWESQDCEWLVVTGELYGGGIQNRISYGNKDFRVFSVACDGVVWDVSTTRRMCGEYGLESVPLLFKGTYDECMSFDVDFVSKLSDKGDKAEGVTIQPIDPSWDSRGERIWIKRRSKGFSEKAKFKIKTPKVTCLPEEGLELLAGVSQYFTEGRVYNTLSKIEVSKTEFGKLMGLTVKDAVADFEKDTGKDLKKLAEVYYKKFVKEVEHACSLVVRPVFLKHIASIKQSEE